MSVKNHNSQQLGVAYNDGNHFAIGNTITCRKGRRQAARQEAKLLKKLAKKCIKETA